MPNPLDKPLVVIDSAAVDIGSPLADTLARDYTLVGRDRPGTTASVPFMAADLSSDEDVERALALLHEQYGPRIASVIHLAAYFDFTGCEANPLYAQLNAAGTRSLLAALQKVEIEQLVYSAGTMLVHGALCAGRAQRREPSDRPQVGLPAFQGCGERRDPRGARPDSPSAFAPRWFL